MKKKSWIIILVICLTIILAAAWITGTRPGSKPIGQGEPVDPPPISAPMMSGPIQAGSEAEEPAGQSLTPEAQSSEGGVITGFSAKHDTSPPLRSIKPLPPIPWTVVRPMGEGEEVEELAKREPRPQIQDPVLQSEFSPGRPGAPSAPMPSTLQNFEGINNLDGVYPPDTNIDVGPNHVVEMVNLHFQIFNKSGTSLYGPALNNTLWTGFGAPCETRNDGDPVVLYDPIADRWILSQFAYKNPNYGECIAVSTSPDPTGSYYRYFFLLGTNVGYDYPKLGVWPDAYYLTANRFGPFYEGASAIALDRAAMLGGLTAAFQQFDTSTSYGPLLPSDLDGPTLPPAGSPNYILEIGANVLHLWKFHVDWATPANSTFSGPTSLTTASFNQLCPLTRNCIPQPSTTQGLDGLADRLMHRLIYRNFGDHETLAVSHTVNAASSGAQAGVRWYEIRNPNGSPSIYQQGTYAPDANHRWMSSLAMDKQGNLAVGYSVSSSSVYPSIRYAGRLVSDPLGTLPQTETALINGTGSQTGTGARWGDYSSMSIDPADDCTFWYTNEYLSTTGAAPWRTRIGSFRFAGCPGPTAVTFAGAPWALSQLGRVVLSWETAQELELVGFNVWRSEAPDDHGAKLNLSLIEAQAAGGLGGANYFYTDDMPLAGKISYYWLEVIDKTGSSFLKDPILVNPPNFLTLPLILGE